MKRLLFAILLVLLAAQLVPAVQMYARAETVDEMVWQPQGRPYVFVCEESDAGMSCLARSSGGYQGTLKETIIS